jgi:hypothetical protein
MEWVLTICLGVSWAGCGSNQYRTYPSEDSCYRALDHMHVSNASPVAESENRRDVVAYCSPVQPSIQK